MVKENLSISRRGFLKLGTVSVAGMIIGLYLPSSAHSSESSEIGASGFAPNAWLAIEENNQVTMFLGKSEMGQGVMTALPMLIAEELEVDLAMVRVEMAISASRFGNQYTGGSQSIRENWLPLRKAGAAARLMLIAAAAEKWGVSADTCYAEQGVVIHKNSQQRLRYGELVATAAKQPIPDNIQLKNPENFRVIGQQVERLDISDKVSGRAKFGMDISLPGMLVATIAHSPVFGGKVKSYDAQRALSVKGVRHVMEIDSGVVVVADGYWQAMKGVQRLQIQWYSGEYPETNTENILTQYAALAKVPSEIVYETGTENAGTVNDTLEIKATYQLPFQSHATMETMNCTAHVHGKGCDIWAPTQHPQGARNAAAEYVYGKFQKTLEKIYSRFTGNIYPNIVVHKTYLGCGFGRRLEHDFVIEAVQISKKLGLPIKLIWSRQEDMQQGYYRPGTYNKLHAVLDNKGLPLNWVHRIVGPVKGLSVDGAANIPYTIPYHRIESAVLKTGIPIGSWRSTGGSLNTFIIESFIDEIAAVKNADPYFFRRMLLTNKPRHEAVLTAAAKAAQWGTVLSKNHFQGIALYEARNSIVAQVVEISISNKGEIKIHKVVCAIDCGIVVNHEIVKSQLEGGIIFGLSAAIKHEITFKNGRVVEKNFDDYPILRMYEVPEIEVIFVAADRSPGGVGEVAVPLIAPAIANAIFSATGKRVRKLPIMPDDIM
ncbi:Isoquinoline 1-oxidoreductase beta subunit [hydrothermal vent metagenome]|uniref:Isoquinoline 1-oxidoreductase beta subunit n=1 Tax=hydrothermal vent metagenome TaxID=652676 RepID=A0A3B1AFZ5_9ZZZZ